MATVKLILQQPYEAKSGKESKKKLNPRETRLYCFLILDRDHMIKMKTEYVILPREWDFDIQGKKEILAGAIEFNKNLRKLREEIWDKYKELIQEYPDMSFEQLSQHMKEYAKTKEIPVLNNKIDFFKVLDDYITSLEGIVAPATVKKFTTLKNSLVSFGKENQKYQRPTFSMIDHNFLEAYRKYLRNQKPRGRQKTRPEGDWDGLLLSTQEKYIKSLKNFCKYAEERGYNKYSIYKEFTNCTKSDLKRKKFDEEIVTLTLSELRQFYTYDFSKKPYLERVKDVFCFGCFTGQRWGDFSRIDKSQLEDDVWTFIADKTLKKTEIDLIGYAAPALDILKKYNYELPQISLQKFNTYLKEAAREAGITEETKIIRYVGVEEIVIKKPKSEFLSSHSARRTCVSILLNDYNLSIVHVMGITGHTDMKTLQKYIRKDREARRNAINNTKSITEIMTVKRNAVG
jgi:integrase